MILSLSFWQGIALLLAIAGPLVGILAWLIRIDRRLNSWMIEHEMLIRDFADRKGYKVEELPTRNKPVW
jgi:hypothetical protein